MFYRSIQQLPCGTGKYECRNMIINIIVAILELYRIYMYLFLCVCVEGVHEHEMEHEHEQEHEIFLTVLFGNSSEKFDIV